MEKLSQLLNESTIVEFKLLWKLVRRYRSHFFAAVVLSLAIFVYTYSQQPIIYAVNVPIKVVANHTVAHDLSALVPVENGATLNVNELKISLDNFTFMKSFAKLVVKDPSFEKFNLGSTLANKKISGKKIKTTCGNDNNCVVDAVASALKPLFSIEQGLTENRFVLSVNAIDRNTVQVITPILMKAIDENRIHVRQYLVLKEIQSVSNLIAESRSIMQKMDGYQALEDQEKLQSNIDSQKEELKILQYNATQEQANFKALESRMLENRRSTNGRNISSTDEYDSIVKGQARLIELSQNLAILTTIPAEKRSKADNLIIEQLKEEKDRLIKTLPSAATRRSLQLNENFLEGQRSKAGDIEFDYIVSKNKLEKLTSDYEEGKEELEQMLEEKINSENKVVGLKTDLEFLKNLEAKLMSLKLLNASMTSDLYFEDTSSLASEFRQSSYIKLMLFSFGITMFIYLLSLIIRFLFDDRIYGEEEIRGHLKGLDFVGEVPKFD